MIHTVRYICEESGQELTSSNISYKTTLGYQLSCDYEITGKVSAKVYLVVNKCGCGQSHKFLVDAETETVD